MLCLKSNKAQLCKWHVCEYLEEELQTDENHVSADFHVALIDVTVGFRAAVHLSMSSK